MSGRSSASSTEALSQPMVVPASYRRHPVHPHGGPPGQAKKRTMGSVYREVEKRNGPARFDAKQRGDWDDKDKGKSHGKGKS